LKFKKADAEERGSEKLGRGKLEKSDLFAGSHCGFTGKHDSFSFTRRG